MDEVRSYVDAVATEDVLATLRWLDEAGYRVTADRGGPAESFGNVLLVFTGRREVEITRDRGQWLIGVALAPVGERLALDVLAAAQEGVEWQPPPHREPCDGLLPDQLPERILWSVTLPIVLESLDEPGAEELARTATRKARDAMRRWWQQVEDKRS
jgi:hypothetical protein